MRGRNSDRGWYRSTPHRVRNAQGPEADAHSRWDAADLHAFEGTYGDYLIEKVSRVFPDLARGRIVS